ncbi:MAG: outer membrane lipoprotein carrier protein LolA [Nitrospirae bacterium]|nr:outer membrane lipoprotein carrier protein LolA [Nitrospirota bacterium]
MLPIVILTVTPVIATDIPSEVLRIQKAYEGISDIKGTFIQKTYIKDLEKTKTYKGEFFIKRPSKMRWTYQKQGKVTEEIIIKGKEMLIYQKEKSQAFKGAFDRQSYGQTPVALLNGFADIQSEFEITKKGTLLYLKPKSPMGGINSIELEPSETGFPIMSFKVTDSYSNTIEIILSDVRLNTGLKDSIFEPRIPEGISIYEYNP